MSWYYPESRDVQLEWRANFMLLDVTQRIATAMAHSGNQFFEYIEYFHLVQINEDWVIVNQLSYPKLME